MAQNALTRFKSESERKTVRPCEIRAIVAQRDRARDLIARCYGVYSTLDGILEQPSRNLWHTISLHSTCLTFLGGTESRFKRTGAVKSANITLASERSADKAYYKCVANAIK